ncbi:MAG: flagellar biosynthesis protein FlhB [Sedimentisphaerales bacterium]|jgi:flagellar biosynthetic protein FlhB
MPDASAAERTEQPTAKRLLDARSKGNVPQIHELVSVVTLLALMVTIALLSEHLAVWATSLIKEGMSCRTQVFSSPDTFINFFNTKIIDSIIISIPIFAAMTVCAVFISLALIGPNFASGAIQLKFDAINPTSGIQQLFNMRSLVALLVSIIKLILISIIVWVYLSDQIDTFMKLRWAWSAQIITTTGGIIFGVCIRVCIAVLVLAIAETFYQKWQYTENLKMTKEEVKQEHKDTEGSPEIKGRIRRIQLQMSLKRMLQEVPKAKVVLVNPTHFAVAIKYDQKTMIAPMVVAKGADHMAEKIMEVARAYGVPIVRRPELTRTIFATVPIDKPIPQELYVAVAEVMAMLHRLRQKRRKS